MIGMSESDLEALVAARCAPFGVVKKLRVYLPRKDSLARLFVLVDMETPEQAAMVASATGGRLTLDNAVVILLRQEQPCASVLVRGKPAFDQPATAYPSLNVEL